MRFKQFLKENTGRTLLTSKEDIIKWLKKYGIKQNKQISISVSNNLGVHIINSYPESIRIEDADFEYFPFNFESISSHLDINRCKNLRSLEGLPANMEKYMVQIRQCDSLTSLFGAPEAVKLFKIIDCANLKSLEHSPSRVSNYFCVIGKSSVTSLQGIPDAVSSIEIPGVDIDSLSGIDKHINFCSYLYFGKDKIKKSALGLLKIKGLEQVLNNSRFDHASSTSVYESEPWMDVINKFLPDGDILDCQEALIEAGFEEYAKL